MTAVHKWFHENGPLWMAFWLGFSLGLLWCRFVIFKRPR